MTTFEKLIIKIKEDIGLDVEDLRRTYSGIHMKSTGSFCWRGKLVGSKIEVGGCTPASELLKSKKLIKEKGFGFGEIEISGCE